MSLEKFLTSNAKIRRMCAPMDVVRTSLKVARGILGERVGDGEPVT
jgi:hypothetical protein